MVTKWIEVIASCLNFFEACQMKSGSKQDGKQNVIWGIRNTQLFTSYMSDD